MNVIVLNLSFNEVWPLSNLLNEICNGLRVKEFEKKILVREEVAEDLLHRIGEMLRSVPEEEYCKVKKIELEQWEVKVILNAMKEVYNQIDTWEFGIRIGIDVPEMQAIERKLKAALDPDAKMT